MLGEMEVKSGMFTRGHHMTAETTQHDVPRASSELQVQDAPVGFCVWSAWVHVSSRVWGEVDDSDAYFHVWSTQLAAYQTTLNWKCMTGTNHLKTRL